MSIGKIELSVGAVKYVDPNEIFTEEEIDAINNKIPELDERVDIIESEVEFERKRIDNLAKLEEGSTTGDAELIDGRIGGNGVTYSNIGNAIRGQYKEVYDNVYSMSKGTPTMLTNVTLTDGKAIHSTGKTYTSANSSCCEDYINIGLFEVIEATIVNLYTASYFIGFYDVDKTFISRTAITTKIGTITVKIPSNTVYIRFSIPIEAKNEFILKGFSKLQTLVGTSSYIIDFNGLKSACENSEIKTIVLCSDITATSSLSIVGNKHIVANNFKITGNTSIEYLLTVSDNKCIIDDLIISDANYNVICCNGGVTVLRNCEVYNSFNNNGVGVHGNSDVFIYDCKIHDCRDEGLSSHGNSYCEIYNTHVYRNGWELGTDTPSNLSFGGLHLGGSRMGIIANCRAYKNTSHGISFITIDNDYSADAECICYNNLTYDNDEAGICFGGATNIVCSNNASVNNASGIRFTKKVDHGNNGIVFGNCCFNNKTNYSIWTGANEGLIFDTTT